jgi:serine/threonine protein phosphatase PrpC
MEVNPLTFTIQIPNTSHGLFKDEDAPPISEKHLFAIADGVGGSGAGKIRLPVFDTIQSLLNKFFNHHPQKDFLISDDRMKVYAERCFSSVVRETIKEKSSAYIGSRFLMMHLLGYYLLQEKSILEHFQKGLTEDLAEKIGDDITAYMKQVIPVSALNFEFHLIPRSSFNIKILPTTLAGGLVYDDGKKVHLVSLWAGDSKGFMFKNHETRMVTKDHYAPSQDGDDSADMTNSIRCLVTPKGEIKADDFYIESKYIAEHKPLTLAYISDGLFSPLETHGDARIAQELPYHFFTLLNTAESLNDYQQKLFAFYEDVKNIYTSDDRTVSWVAFGFESFELLKKHYLENHRILNFLSEKRELVLKASEEKSTREKAVSTLRGEMVRAMPEVVKLLTYEPYFFKADYLNHYSGFLKVHEQFKAEKIKKEKEQAIVEQAIRNAHRQIIELVYQTKEWQSIEDAALRTPFVNAQEAEKNIATATADIAAIEKSIKAHQAAIQNRIFKLVEKMDVLDHKIKEIINHPRSILQLKEMDGLYKEKNRILESLKSILLFYKFNDDTQLEYFKNEGALYKDAHMLLKNKESLTSKKRLLDIQQNVNKNVFITLYHSFANYFIDQIFNKHSMVFSKTVNQFEPLKNYFILGIKPFPKRQIELAINEHIVDLIKDSFEGKNPLLNELPQGKITNLIQKLNQTIVNLFTKEERKILDDYLNNFWIYFLD